mgnify:CR=1 FL=1
MDAEIERISRELWQFAPGFDERAAIKTLLNECDRLTKALEARKTTAAGIEGARFPLWTSSPDFDAWYLSLERVHPCAEFEGDADQFVIGDLVDAFEAGKALGLKRGNRIDADRREELLILRDIADIARPRCRDTDRAALCDAFRRLNAFQAKTTSAKGETP